MNTFELIEELMKKSKQEIQYVLLQMLISGKFSFFELSNLYVTCLEEKKKDLHSQLCEAETCLVESFYDKKTKDKNKDVDYKHTQHSLYVLNRSQMFQMNALNEKYNYDEDYAKSLSLYEMEKK